MAEEVRESVSIVMPTYNRGDLIGRSIESILGQSYPYYELLIIDDGSADRTEEVVRAYQRKDSRVIYIKSEKNQGQSHARNIGLRQARYVYLAFQDSDDSWRKDKLKKQMEVLAGTGEETGFVYGRFQYDFGQGQILVMPDSQVSKQQAQGDIYEKILRKNLIGMPALVMKKQCLDKTGYFDESLRSLEDYDFCLRLAKHYKALFIDEVVLDAAASEGGVSSHVGEYLMASCLILAKYKEDYLKTDTFNYRLEKILRDAEEKGFKQQVVGILEKLLGR